LIQKTIILALKYEKKSSNAVNKLLW